MFSQTTEGKKIIRETMSKIMTGMVTVYDINGNGLKVTKQEYQACKNSELPVEEWKYAQNRSKEGQRRKTLKSA